MEKGREDDRRKRETASKKKGSSLLLSSPTWMRMAFIKTVKEHKLDNNRQNKSQECTLLFRKIFLFESCILWDNVGVGQSTHK
jgi:hypothetical protein